MIRINTKSIKNKMSDDEQQFNMVQTLTEELCEKEDKIILLEKIVDDSIEEKKEFLDREFVKDTYIKYVKTTGLGNAREFDFSERLDW